MKIRRHSLLSSNKIILTFKLRLITGTSYTEKETISFNFEVGMTIGEWVNSEYNV